MGMRELKRKVGELSPVLTRLLALGSELTEIHIFNCYFLVLTAALSAPALSTPLHDRVCLQESTCFPAVPRARAAVGAAKSRIPLLKLPVSTDRRV